MLEDTRLALFCVCPQSHVDEMAMRANELQEIQISEHSFTDELREKYESVNNLRSM